jgi:cyclic-di-AMP phosphodiesterase PgpH
MLSHEDPHHNSQIDKWHRWLGENQWGKQWVIGILFVVLLATFLHFREERVEVLELNTTAEHYLIGQIDFSFPDEEATLILKEQSLRDIGRIYKLDEKEVSERRFEFENELIHGQDWRQEHPTVTFEEAYKGLDAFEEALLQSHFMDARTLQKVRELRLPMEGNYVLTVPEPLSPLLLPKEFWGKIEKKIFIDEELNPDAVALILSYFEHKKWALEKDSDEERLLRRAAEERVPQVYTQVVAGSKIISPGETVSPRQIAMLKAMKKALMEHRKLWEPLTILGSLLLSLIFTTLSILYLRMHDPGLLHSFKRLLLFMGIIVFTLLLSKVNEYVLVNKANNLVNVIRYPLFVPFAAILLSVLLTSQIALFASGFLTIVLGVTLATDHDRFLVINLTAALVAIIYARKLHKRNEVFTVCAKVWLSCIPVIIAFNLIETNFWNLNLMTDMISSFLFMFVTALLVVGILPLLESLFGVMTDMSLMEYMDPNGELLRRLNLEAPGTYQHSLVVGNLAETAARAIGANGLFCRAATLYHDVGKLFNPHYFTENQLGGFNIHQLLTPQESAQVILAHVPEGEALARKYRLPRSFIDIIREHHGTTLVYYFYSEQVKQMGGDVSKVDERLFRYPGPKPHSRESAIIMIADTIEAASRSLDEVTEEIVVETVDRLIAERVEEGELDECQLTFEELSTVKKTIIKNLVVTRHLRIKYPARH